MAKKTIHIINNSQVSSKDMSGGEKIAMELARRWAKKAEVRLYSSNLGIAIWKRYHLNQVKKIQWLQLADPSSVFSYLKRSLVGCFKGFKISFPANKQPLVYSASDFWPDFWPAFLFKLRNPQVVWLAGFYLFAPLPWSKVSPYKRNWLKGFFYWLTQMPVYFLIKRFADLVLVTNQLDAKRFITLKRPKNKVVVVQGGLDFKEISQLRTQKPTRQYQAVFIGRFHPQKGGLELIDIWAKVVEKIPQAKLALIGQGPLLPKIKDKIKHLNLNKNINLLGFLDGPEKIKVFYSSEIVLHPAIYDSGGMAAIEAMACGLPGVSFDLPALKTYYPQAMLKTPCFKQNKLSQNIIKLLEDRKLYQRLSCQAVDLAKTWDWDKKAKQIWQKINHE